MRKNGQPGTNSAMAEGKKDRIIWVDVFRGLMIFAIAWGHALTVKSLAYNEFSCYIYSFHVPAFFFISGYLFKAKNQSFLPFLIKKTKTLLVPYCIFSLLSILFFWILGQTASQSLDVVVKTTDILPNIGGMLYANGATGYMKWNLPLWFIPCLFAMTLLFYGVNRMIEKLTGIIGFHLSMAIILLVSFSLAVLNFRSFHFSKLPFGFETVIYMLPFFTIGYWVKNGIDFKKIKTGCKAVICVAGLCIGVIMSIHFYGRVDYVSSVYGNIFMFYGCAMVSIAGYTMLAQFISWKWLGYMGRNTLSILLMHKFPIVFLQILLMNLLNNTLQGIVLAFVIAAISCVLSLGIGELIRHSCPAVLGEKRTFKG